jgi:hypothetical protein
VRRRRRRRRRSTRGPTRAKTMGRLKYIEIWKCPSAQSDETRATVCMLIQPTECERENYTKRERVYVPLV